MVDGTEKQATGEKEARKRTWRRGPQDRTLQSNKGWTLKALGGKTIWDWLQLLIVPVALAVIGFLFTVVQQNVQYQIETARIDEARRVEDMRAQAAQKIEEQRAQDAALEAYLDQMSELIIEETRSRS